ncbi:unnamed protein product [Tenebrio molitor]|nr:unnamed protein product [Tenebrio molitor]
MNLLMQFCVRILVILQQHSAPWQHPLAFQPPIYFIPVLDYFNFTFYSLPDHSQPQLVRFLRLLSVSLLHRPLGASDANILVLPSGAQNRREVYAYSPAAP